MKQILFQDCKLDIRLKIEYKLLTKTLLGPVEIVVKSDENSAIKDATGST